MAKQDNGDKQHSLKYIKQMMDWGFDKDFIAKDCNINLASLETRLRRANERERNGNQRTKPGVSSDESDSR